MEANELRLGNYIRNMYGEVIIVDLTILKQIYKGELFGVIELTEEIILNCGLVADNWAEEAKVTDVVVDGKGSDEEKKSELKQKSKPKKSTQSK